MGMSAGEKANMDVMMDMIGLVGIVVVTAT
jgi:hypothetical protein